MTMFEITFCFENSPDTVVITADPRESILEAARKANVAIDAPCSGNGSCGKCRVQILEGQIEGNQTQHISDEEFAAGWCLSCCCRAASDLKVLVPDIASAYKSRMKTADLSSGEEIAIFEALQQEIRDSGIRKAFPASCSAFPLFKYRYSSATSPLAVANSLCISAFSILRFCMFMAVSSKIRHIRSL